MQSSFARTVGSGTLTIETGKLAQQANGSVLVHSGGNVMLVAATMSKPREGIDFFPLTIDLEERLYARGKIPGSFFRREGRPSTHSVLIARLTDRPLRPLFPKGFRNEVQIVITPLSLDQESPFDILALTGASAALSVSDIPFNGPVAASRIGYVNREFVVNPTYAQLEEGQLDVLVASNREGVVMIEAGADEIPDDIAFEAIKRAHEVNLGVIELQDDLARSAGKPKVSYEPSPIPPELMERARALMDGRIGAALSVHTSKEEQEERVDALKDELITALGDDFEPNKIKGAFETMLEEDFCARVLSTGNRPDGRGPKDMRSISCEVALLPRTHGSGLFTRGETQVLGVVTLGSPGDAQKLDNLGPADSKRFLLHYNFPPYSVGEVRRMIGPGRREIGHGALAEKALVSSIPSEEEFPYTIRVVSEVLSSNGSTSMGTVCAATLALMDAGVPIKTPIAGISVGLVTGENGRYVTLTDIQGLEDHVGDMDFKVAGSSTGVTAMQLDIKVNSIGFDVISDALQQAREARLFLLDRIREAISDVRPELSTYAPRMISINIPVSKIGMVIGPGGRTIRGIVEETKANIDVQNDGTVVVSSADSEASERAVQMVMDLTRDIQIGDIYTGKVVKITTFGAFVALTPGKDGMVHISELADYHVPAVEDVVNLGEEITVKVIDVDPTGRVKLSRRALLESTDEPQNTGDADPAAVDPVPADGPGPDSRPAPPGGSRPGYTDPRGPRPGGPGGPQRRGSGPQGQRPGGRRDGGGPRPMGGRRPQR